MRKRRPPRRIRAGGAMSRRHRRSDPMCVHYRPMSTRTALGRWRDLRSRGQNCPTCCPSDPDALDRLHLSAPDIRFKWRSDDERTPDDKQSDVLALKPRCKRCGRMFHTRYKPPRDLVCRDCRHEPPDIDPAEVLF